MGKEIEREPTKGREDGNSSQRGKKKKKKNRLSPVLKIIAREIGRAETAIVNGSACQPLQDLKNSLSYNHAINPTRFSRESANAATVNKVSIAPFSFFSFRAAPASGPNDATTERGCDA